jgi:surface protein
MARGFVSLPTSGGGASTGDWVRPTDWLAMPTVTSSDQKFVGLHAIFPDGNNFVAFSFTTSTGQYQVDWGDGSSPTLHNSGVNAEYAYNYSTYDVGNTTLSTRGYKQAIITVTPVSGNLLTANFQQRYTGQNQAYATGFLDCIISMPNHSASAFTFGGTTVRHSYVERFDVKTLGSCNSLSGIFLNFYSLQSVPLFNTSSVTNMSQMFNNCVSIKKVPLFNTASVANMVQMFSACSSIQSVPLFNTSSVTNMSGMFNTCLSLQSIPLFNTTSVTNMSNMVGACYSLQSIPALSTASITTTSGTDYSSAFANNANSLDRCQMVFARTVGFLNCQLSATALNEIFTNLVDRSATTQASITITGNYGAATANTAIATAKNWQVIN